MIATDVDDRFNKWLGFFNVAVAAKDVDALLILFHPDAFWRDLLAFTWNVRTVEGHGEIRQMLDACLARTAPTAWRQTRPARLEDGIVEGIVEFETQAARCQAVIRLREGKVWTLLTSMAELNGLEASPSLDYVSHGGGDMAAMAKQPYCVIVGAGHCGLGLGVQLRNLGVPTLIIDRRERPSDTWRNRHDSLLLHTPSYFDQMPGFSYPDDWPLHPSKERFADWLDAYQSVMQLDVMTAAECVGAVYDDARGKWRLQVKRRDRAIELNPEQLVLATGLFGAPKIPDIPGKERFKGPQQHASLYRSNPHHRNCRCVVVGSGTTAHDIAADLFAGGADVTMIQRSPTIVMKLERLIEGFARLYGSEPKAQGMTTDLADLLLAATPLRTVVGVHQKLVKHVKEKDAAFYRRLESVGFRLTFGEDESGVFPQVLRDPGGYYIDVGASELVANGSIKLRSGVGITALREESVVLSDGSELPADIIFYATGYERSSFESILTPETAKRVGPLWGFGSGTRRDPGPWQGELRNMWKPTQQKGLWFHSGGIGVVRFYSRILALQIKARQAGIATPVYEGEAVRAFEAA
ncbi:NAD(P)/FAD-dependent oxidoreductase [Bradyrhizobium neotropicale]|uniref:NAD(P)/FAD-dependent oxidoreductase n=1 Tax=Bradyrhizobium neotropicale TaxID=1497615 RepID=UPI001AD706AA|nr:NAD(P)/FAD-dependent oxidoreductase [Bradyrhizobium neotropicale]MBO4225160.1 NAD(P)-binding domain-containing protein [Bradyrhizobium neotropicale]